MSDWDFIVQEFRIWLKFMTIAVPVFVIGSLAWHFICLRVKRKRKQ